MEPKAPVFRLGLVSVVRATLVVVAIVGLTWLTWRLSYVGLLFFASVIVAATLLATAGLVEKWTPLNAKLSLAVAGLLFAIILIVFLVLLGNQIASQFSSVMQEAPRALASLGDRFGIDIQQQLAGTRSWWVGSVMGYAPDLIGAIASTILVIVGGAFLAIDPKMYREGALKLVPHSHRDQVRSAMLNSGDALKKWLWGKAIAMVVIGVVTTAGLYLLGIPSALVLGLIAGLLEFIPFLGPILSFVPAGLVAFSHDDTSFWWVLGLYVLIQQLENNLLVPLIQQQTVSLPPVLGLFAIVAIGMIFGPLGVIFGIPLTIVLLVFLKQIYLHDTLGEDVHIPGKD